ncbi:MAG: ParB/RepB/Spo0J family partition protein, partial [Deltaproteobacteria bacterium]|nr:ParB/RepB/Spo0J family partition protein [Deltaproteobacteria bacterium]
MSSKSKNTGLGKGLEGLIDINTEVNVNEINKEHSGSPLKVLINNIEPNPDQPRKYFKKDEMESLVESIRQKGILEPLLARKIDNQKFELIAGHRRLRAAKEAGLKEVPIVILEIGTDLKERLEIALVENLIRQNLNPIEEAESFARLENEFGKKDADIARLIGRDRSSV